MIWPTPRSLLTLLGLMALAASALAQAPPTKDRLVLARVEMRDYEYRRAEAIYREVLVAEPENVTALLGLARALRGVGDHPGATRIYEDLLKRDPKDFRPHVGLSLLAVYVDRKKEARSHCAAALVWFIGTSTAQEAR